MKRRPLVMSPSYQAVVRGFQELHRLEIQGLQESPEADAIRDALDTPWEGLTEVERRRIAGLSEDLYSISEPPAEEPRPVNPQVQARLDEARQAEERGEWDRALEILRRWKAYLDPAALSFLRGSIWQEAGDLESAVLFFEHAARLMPDDPRYARIFLSVLNRTAPAVATQRARAILDEAAVHPAGLVIDAAFYVLQTSLKADASDMLDLSGRLIPLIERLLAECDPASTGLMEHSDYVAAANVLGLAYINNHNYQNAIRAYSRGLLVDPFDGLMLAVRGILQYGTSHQAIDDLREAIRQDCKLSMPYYLLAHDHLTNGRFDECRRLCERAEEIPAPESVRSEMAEWKGIAQAELGFPPMLVRAAFEEALRLDPTNDRARHNLAAFEGNAGRRMWETRQVAAVRATGMAAVPFLPSAA